MIALQKIFIQLLLALISIVAFAQEPATITLVNSPLAYDGPKMIIDLQQETEINTWNKDSIQVIIEVKATDINCAVIRHLISKCRFKVDQSFSDNGSLILSMPNLEQSVFINGEKLNESIICQVYVPEGTAVSVFDSRLFHLDCSFVKLAAYERAR